MAVTDVVTLRVVGRYQNQNIVNTLHYQITAQTSNEQDVLDNLLIGWETDVKASWLARHDDDYELIGLKGFNKVGAAKTPAVRAIGESGDVVGTGVAAGLCRTITLYTADAKFRRRGRVMLSAGDTTMFDADDGSVTSAEVALLTALGVVLIAQISQGGDDFDPGIPATAVDPFQQFTDAVGRVTPSMVRSRRIREFLIG